MALFNFEPSRAHPARNMSLKAALSIALLDGDEEAYPRWVNKNHQQAAHKAIDHGATFQDALQVGLKLRTALRATHDQRVTALLSLVGARARRANNVIQWTHAARGAEVPPSYHTTLVTARRFIEAGACLSDILDVIFGADDRLPTPTQEHPHHVPRATD